MEKATCGLWVLPREPQRCAVLSSVTSCSHFPFVSWVGVAVVQPGFSVTNSVTYFCPLFP